MPIKSSEELQARNERERLKREELAEKRKKAGAVERNRRYREKKKAQSVVLAPDETPISPKEREFVRLYVVEGKPVTVAAREAGFTSGDSYKLLLAKPAVVAQIRASQYEIAKTLKVTRNKVLEGMMEAIEIAKVQEDPTAMIRGWTEVGKICGYYEKKVVLKDERKAATDNLKSLSTEDLVALATGKKSVADLLPETLEGEFSEVTDA